MSEIDCYMKVIINNKSEKIPCFNKKQLTIPVSQSLYLSHISNNYNLINYQNEGIKHSSYDRYLKKVKSRK